MLDSVLPCVFPLMETLVITDGSRGQMVLQIQMKTGDKIQYSSE